MPQTIHQPGVTIAVDEVTPATEPLPECRTHEAVKRMLDGEIESCCDYHGTAIKDVPRESTEYTFSTTRYTRRDGGRRGLVLAVGNRVIHIEAADDRTVNARLADLPFLVENPEKGPVALLFTRHLSLMLLGILGFFLLWFALLMRAGSWAGSISPAPGVAPVQAEALRARLLAVNDLGLPFRVREEGAGWWPSGGSPTPDGSG